jgi:LytS/YehU family sensor histidine kinase
LGRDQLLAAGRDKAATLEQLQGEIALFKSQFDSHFLYNTLGYFYSKTYMHSAELAEGFMKLSQVMRYSLKETSVAFVPITEEVHCLLNLIAIHQLRFENKLQVGFETEGELGGKKILRLVMVALVQNAFWPSSPVHANEALSIRLSVRTGSTHLSIRSQKGMDNVPVLSEKQISVIKQRLQWAYGEKYQLGVQDHTTHSECTLTIYDDTAPWGAAFQPQRPS